MTSYDTMASALRETGLYALSGETLVDAELAAYAAALDVLYERLEALQKDSFLCTAGEEGLSRWEALFGLQIQGSLEERRKALLQCGAVHNNSNTCGDFLKLLESVGIEATILEDPSGQRLCFNCTGLESTEARANAVAYLERFLPAHLNVILDFRDLSWNTIDHAEKTFDEWDAGNSTWDQLDLAEDELFER